jgi:hypothetical protein
MIFLKSILKKFVPYAFNLIFLAKLLIKNSMMKKSTFVSASFILFASLTMLGQTAEQRSNITSGYDLQKLENLEVEFAQKFAAEKAEALQMAAIKGWPEFKTLTNGGFAELVGVFESGEPIYYATENREGAITTRTDRVHTGGGAGLNLNGENMQAGVWDGGRVRNSHDLLENRVTQIDNPSGFSSHATHVSGTMIGTGTVQGGAAKGMAPEAELIAYDFSNDESEMASAAGTGLLISNHSYGIPADDVPLWYVGYYDSNARDLDLITYSAPFYLPVCSAGNDRTSGANPGDGGYDYLTDKSVSKNSIVCAAVFEVLNYTGPNSVNMSSFSSWGPTDDGRIKPDLSAKGVNMLSSTANSNSSYGNFSGTSMATPNISGSLILLQQHYSELNGGDFMLASTLRALALHTADEAGNAPGPDYRFGWGLMNTERAAGVITDNGTNSLIIEETLVEGDVYTFSVQADGVGDLMASIAWTDPAGTVAPGGVVDRFAPALVNDLDIRISTDGGTTFLPWVLDVASPSAAATNGDNLVDNFEKIEIAGASGEYIITVSHKGSITNSSQVFSLIVTGIDREDFAVTSHDGLEKACEGTASQDFEIDVDFNDGFSETVNFTVADVPSGASATISPTSLNNDGTLTLSVTNISNLVPGEYPIKVTGTGTSQTVNVYVVLRIEEDNLEAIALLSPEDGEVDLPTVAVNFDWEAGPETVSTYDFELATDDTFSTIISSQSVTENMTNVTNLDFDTEYFWRVRANNDCSTAPWSTTFSFTTEIELGINENRIDGLVVYPNPANNLLNVDANEAITSIEVMNVLGQTLINHSMESGTSAKVDLSALSTGNYFVRVTAGDNSTVMQIVKK